MMYPLIYATILPILFLKQKENPVPKEYAFPLVEKVLHISPPPGFHRKQVEPGSFAYWLRNVTLKTDKTVYLYNGALKKNQDAQYAVLDITTGEEDLQQCADAVIRLRAEYLFYHCRFNEIIFFDNQKKIYQFKYPFSRSNFEQYLKKVFNWCGTLSLEKTIKSNF